MVDKKPTLEYASADRRSNRWLVIIDWVLVGIAIAVLLLGLGLLVLSRVF